MVVGKGCIHVKPCDSKDCRKTAQGHGIRNTSEQAVIVPNKFAWIMSHTVTWHWHVPDCRQSVKPERRKSVEVGLDAKPCRVAETPKVVW